MITERHDDISEEAKRSIRKMNEWAERMLAKPGAVKKFMVKNGFVTKTGKLPKRYGG